MGLLKYKGYTGSVDYSEEDNCLYGKVLGMSKDMITYEGQDVNELRRDFEGAIDDYLALCKANGKAPRAPYSGNLNIRITSLKPYVKLLKPAFCQLRQRKQILQQRYQLHMRR